MPTRRLLKGIAAGINGKVTSRTMMFLVFGVWVTCTTGLIIRGLIHVALMLYLVHLSPKWNSQNVFLISSKTFCMNS